MRNSRAGTWTYFDLFAGMIVGLARTNAVPRQFTGLSQPSSRPGEVRKSTVKLDGDLRRHLVDRALYFIGGVCQPICIDVDSDSASLAAHMIAQLETRDRLFEFAPTLRALKSDHDGVRTGHLHPVDAAARRSLGGRAKS
jgi:hypothetical protein